MPEFKVQNKSTSFIGRIKGNNAKKQKAQKPVPELNDENWFFKKFGIDKLFGDDDDDQPM